MGTAIFIWSSAGFITAACSPALSLASGGAFPKQMKLHLIVFSFSLHCCSSSGPASTGLKVTAYGHARYLCYTAFIALWWSEFHQPPWAEIQLPVLSMGSKCAHVVRHVRTSHIFCMCCKLTASLHVSLWSLTVLTLLCSPSNYTADHQVNDISADTEKKHTLWEKRCFLRQYTTPRCMHIWIISAAGLPSVQNFAGCQNEVKHVCCNSRLRTCKMC